MPTGLAPIVAVSSVTATAPHFLMLSHLAYGWMPTVLHLDFNALPTALQRVEEARRGRILTEVEVQQVAAAVNHSVVGASKVLHFVNPALYLIWDRRVYRFCHRTSTGAPPRSTAIRSTTPRFTSTTRKLAVVSCSCLRLRPFTAPWRSSSSNTPRTQTARWSPCAHWSS